MKKLLHNNSFFLVMCSISWLAGLAWVCSHSKFEQMQWINSHRTAWSDTFFWLATQLGEGWFFAAVILVAAGFSYRNSITGIVALAVSTVLSQGLKHLFVTPRPAAFFASMSYPWQLVEGVEVHQAFSFPSGHTTTVFCICTLGNFWLRRKAWGGLFWLLACITAYSRSYLFQHFPEDLLGGAVIGILSAFVSWWLVETYWSSKISRWKKIGFFRN